VQTLGAQLWSQESDLQDQTTLINHLGENHRNISEHIGTYRNHLLEILHGVIVKYRKYRPIVKNKAGFIDDVQDFSHLVTQCSMCAQKLSVFAGHSAQKKCPHGGDGADEDLWIQMLPLDHASPELKGCGEGTPCHCGTFHQGLRRKLHGKLPKTIQNPCVMLPPLSS
jgi:hypothetical protein